jgi:hypothetical protein
MNYNNRKFRAISNSENGEVSTDMIFHYFQDQNILYCEYAGAKIIRGSLLGKVDSLGNIEMVYHQINTKLQIMTGVCTSKPEILPNGKVRLHEKWQWTKGDFSSGESVLEEI